MGRRAAGTGFGDRVGEYWVGCRPGRLDSRPPASAAKILRIGRGGKDVVHDTYCLSGHHLAKRLVLQDVREDCAGGI